MRVTSGYRKQHWGLGEIAWFKRAEGKLANEGFIDKAPADVVAEERRKLAAYRAELKELDG